MIKLIASLLLSLGGLTVITVDFAPPSWWSGPSAGDKGGDKGGDHHFAAPEIDPSSAIGAMTLLIGGMTVLRSRVAKQ
jgi:hypothetical protein